MTNARLCAIGMAVPEKVIDNQYFEALIETTDEWIVSRTGIQTRYHTAADEFTSSLCVRAVQDLAAHYDGKLDDVDMIIVATVSPDQPMPSMACRVQFLLNMPLAGAFDLSAACAGFSYGVILAKGLIAAGTHRKVLVIGAETLSKITDFEDRSSCFLFGDGAGAVLIEAAEAGNIGACITGSNGEGGGDLYMSGLAETLDGLPIKRNRTIVQNGRRVFKWAVTTVSAQIKVLLEKNNLRLDEIDWLVPHSANLRILEAICKEIDFPMAKVLESIVHFGNTSSATIPIALCNAVRSGKVQPGDRILFIGFGGGLVYAGAIIEW
ncbi:MAG: ketoacyl-ACP synthase III [Saprospiraceae bacterium]